MYLHDLRLLPVHVMYYTCIVVEQQAFPWMLKLVDIFTTTFGVSHVLYMSHTLCTFPMNTVSVDCSLDQQAVSYWCVYSHADSQHKSTCRIYTIETKPTPMHAYHTSVYC